MIKFRVWTKKKGDQDPDPAAKPETIIGLDGKLIRVGAGGESSTIDAASKDEAIEQVNRALNNDYEVYRILEIRGSKTQ